MSDHVYNHDDFMSDHVYNHDDFMSEHVYKRDDYMIKHVCNCDDLFDGEEFDIDLNVVRHLNFFVLSLIYFYKREI